eukprot:PhM_4_TR17450/c3_g1_i4/m.36585
MVTRVSGTATDMVTVPATGGPAAVIVRSGEVLDDVAVVAAAGVSGRECVSVAVALSMAPGAHVTVDAALWVVAMVCDSVAVRPSGRAMPFVDSVDVNLLSEALASSLLLRVHGVRVRTLDGVRVFDRMTVLDIVMKCVGERPETDTDDDPDCDVDMAAETEAVTST